MNQLVLHPLTDKQVQAFTAKPSHAVVLVGPAGSGKSSLSRFLVENILDLPVNGFQDYGYGLTIKSVDGKAVGIEAIRQLEHFLSLKVPSDKAFNRAVIIEDAHLLGGEAQNALLKTLEEPPVGAVIVLTASSLQDLLPTIRSRVQTIQVKSPDYDRLKAHFTDQGFSEQQIKQAHAIGGGLAGLMQAIISEEEHPLLQATECARQLLGQTTYERLLQVDELAKQRALATDMLLILQQMAHVSLQKASGPAAKKWQAILEASYEASQKLANSAQPKLVLTDLMLSF